MKKVESITIRVGKDLKEKIVRQAEEEHRDISVFIRHAVLVYLDRLNKA